MSVRRRKQGDITVLDIGGEFYGDRETDDLETVLQGEVQRATKRLLLNLYECSMMNSTALGVVIGAKKKLESAGVEVRMCGLGSRMKSLVVVMQLTKWFKVYDTEKDAVQAFQQAGSSA